MENNLYWSLILNEGNEVDAVTWVYNEALDGGSRALFQWAQQDVERLEAIRKLTPPPVFSVGDWEAGEQLREYSQKIVQIYKAEMRENIGKLYHKIFTKDATDDVGNSKSI